MVLSAIDCMAEGGTMLHESAAAPVLFLPLNAMQAVAGGVHNVPDIEYGRLIIFGQDREIALHDIGCIGAIVA